MKQILQNLNRIIQEGRMVTLSMKMISQIRRTIGTWVAMDIRGINNGTAGLFKNTEDGNLYEIIIRPIAYGETKNMWGDLIVPKKERDSYKGSEPLSNNEIAQIVKTAFKGLYSTLHITVNNKQKIIFKVILLNNISIEELANARNYLEDIGVFSITDVQIDKKNRKHITIEYIKTN